MSRYTAISGGAMTLGLIPDVTAAVASKRPPKYAMISGDDARRRTNRAANDPAVIDAEA